MSELVSLFHQFCQEGRVFERSMGNLSGKLYLSSIWRWMIEMDWGCPRMFKLPKIKWTVIPWIPFLPPLLLNRTNCSQNSWKSSFTEPGENRQSRENGLSILAAFGTFLPRQQWTRSRPFQAFPHGLSLSGSVHSFHVALLPLLPCKSGLLHFVRKAPTVSATQIETFKTRSRGRTAAFFLCYRHCKSDAFRKTQLKLKQLARNIHRSKSSSAVSIRGHSLCNASSTHQ